MFKNNFNISHGNVREFSACWLQTSFFAREMICSNSGNNFMITRREYLQNRDERGDITEQNREYRGKYVIYIHRIYVCKRCFKNRVAQHFLWLYNVNGLSYIGPSALKLGQLRSMIDRDWWLWSSWWSMSDFWTFFFSENRNRNSESVCSKYLILCVPICFHNLQEL